MNLQHNLWKAWIIQKKILSVRSIRSQLMDVVQENEQQYAQFIQQEKQLQKDILHCRQSESALDAHVIRYQTDIARTKEQCYLGRLDIETAQSQCDAIEAKIEGLEEEYFAFVEERETKEKELFLCQQKYKLRERNIEEAKANLQEKKPLLDREEESFEEELQQYLARIPPNHQRHFESHRFSHSNLVARLRDSFCGSCSTRLALGLVGEIVRTANVHLCSTCKAFCIAPN